MPLRRVSGTPNGLSRKVCVFSPSWRLRRVFFDSRPLQHEWVSLSPRNNVMRTRRGRGKTRNSPNVLTSSYNAFGKLKKCCSVHLGFRSLRRSVSPPPPPIRYMPTSYRHAVWIRGCQTRHRFGAHVRQGYTQHCNTPCAALEDLVTRSCRRSVAARAYRFILTGCGASVGGADCNVFRYSPPSRPLGSLTPTQPGRVTEPTQGHPGLPW